MTIRNLDALFAPRSIALIGASNQPGSVGAVVARNLLEGGFRGPVMAVNPHETAIRSTLAYNSVASLPVPPELAVIATPPATVPGLVAEVGARGCRAAVVITAGFGEGDGSLRQDLLDAARPHLLRVLGPNCLGLMSPGAGINASFAHMTPATGEIAFLTQSGAIATAILDWAARRGIGFSHIVSLGDMSDVDFGDMLDWLALDAKTRAIVLYVEQVTQARKFMSAARAASRGKPVIVVKAGRSEAGARAARSHTGALAGSDLVYDAAFRRAGMLRVRQLGELFEAVATLASGLAIDSDRLTIVTNGGGIGVLATDELAERGGALAELGRETIARLDAVLPAPWSHGNPVDILGDASGERYAAALTALLPDRERGALLVLNCPTAVADSVEAARAVAGVLAGAPRTPALTCWLGGGPAAEARRIFAAGAIPTYDTPEAAVRAFTHLVTYRRNQTLLMRTPPAEDDAPFDEARARAVIARALSDGRTLLDEAEAKAVLAACGIPTVPTEIAADPAEAARLAARFGVPVALKILSRDITHKSDVGGVALDLATPEAVETTARAMIETIGRRAPRARLDGFTVQPMVRRPRAHELLAGIAEDATFGPVVMFGHGGKPVEVIGDRVVGLVPLDRLLADELIGRTRIARLLAGYRDEPAADLAAIAATLTRLSRIACAFDELVELDINPLLADAEGVIALDARIVVRPARGAAGQRLAIQPYPRALERAVVLRDGRTVRVRPIRPEDEPAIVTMLERSSPEDVRLRFFRPIKTFGHAFAARLTQIDYDREMALVALDPDEPGAIAGAARLIANPDGEEAEFAAMVRSDLKGQGFGWALMQEILAHARRRGIGRVHGEILHENSSMLTMAKEIGFTLAAGPPGSGTMVATIVLRPAEA